MASRKSLKGVVHDLAESFASLMNFLGDDYVLGHVVQASWVTGARVLQVDLLTGALVSSPLAIPLVRQSLEWYVRRFPELVSANRSDLALVSRAELVVEVDPSRRRPHEYSGSRLEESPFTCRVTVVDDRGRLYEHTVSGWWFPENPAGQGEAAEQARCGSAV